jgi:RND superfamily putative drug exporter
VAELAREVDVLGGCCLTCSCAVADASPSVGASYGVLALVFQHRWAESVLAFHANGTIVSWLPLFLFVGLFGLAMDYHVFILSRVREAVDAGDPTQTAVRRSIASTTGVVTAAAAVLVCVFALFSTLSSLELKQAGVGLAAAVQIDATLIGGVLLPATMKLLGESNWHLPRQLLRHFFALFRPRTGWRGG